MREVGTKVNPVKQREKRERKVGNERKERTSDNERQGARKEGGRGGE